MDKFIVINPANKEVFCIGNIKECREYINQLESITIDSLEFKELREMDTIVYEGFELTYIREYRVVLTEGEVRMMLTSCKEEQMSIRLIEEELNKLLSLGVGSEIFSVDSIHRMEDFKETLDYMKKEHHKYLSNHLMDNLDIESLRYAYLMERENKGELNLYL